MGNGPHVLVDALTPPPPIIPPLLMAPLPMALLFPFAELMPGVASAPLGATILVVIKT